MYFFIGLFNTYRKIYKFFCLIILLLIRVNHPQKIRYGFQTKLMIFWTVYILLLGTQTSDVILFIQRFPTLLIGTLATYIFNYFITDIDQVEKIIRPISLSLIINIILGFMQVIANIYIFSDSTSLFYGTRVPIGAFNNANDFATALIFMLFMQIFIIFRQKSLPKE